MDEGEVAVFEFMLPAKYVVDVRWAYATRDGTAKAGENYRAVKGHVVFPTGTRKATVRILTYEDADLDDQNFELLLFDRQARGLYLGNAWTSAVRIKSLPQRKTVRAKIHDTTMPYTREKYGAGYTGPTFGE